MAPSHGSQLNSQIWLICAQGSAGQASSGAIDRDAAIAIRAAIAAPASRAPAGLADAVSGPAAVNADSNVGNQQTVLLLTALIIVAVILLLVYRPPSCGCRR